jgi:exonuclease SbcC
VRLDTLTIRGVLAFEEERRIVFRDLPEGLIALRGVIGGGKTTILEAPAATVFRGFPSREKKPPFDYATRSDAFLEQTFLLEGRGLYRARLNLDGPHRKQEAVLLRREPDGSEVFVSDRQSLKSYDAAIAELLPPVSDLLASVLAVQTRRGSFSEADRAERRVMLQTLLGLDSYEEKAERARGALAMVVQARTQAEAILDRLAHEDRPDAETTFTDRLVGINAQITRVDERRAALQRALTHAEDALAELEGDARAFEGAFARHRAAEQTIALRTAERQGVEATRTRSGQEAQEERARLVQTHAKWIARNQEDQADQSVYLAEVARLKGALARTVEAAQGKIAKNRDELLSRAAVIRAAVVEYRTAGEALEHARRLSNGRATAIDGYAAAERVLQGTLFELEKKADQLARAQADALLLANVPCHGVGEYAACELLTNAQRAKLQIEALADTGARITSTTAQHAVVQAQLETARADQAATVRTIADLERRRAQVETDASLAPHLDAATEKIKGYEQTIAEAQRQHQEELKGAADRREAEVARLLREAAHQKEEHAARLRTHDAQWLARYESQNAQLLALQDAISVAGIDRQQEAETMAATRDAAAQANAAALTLHGLRSEWDETTEARATLYSQRTTLLAEQAAWEVRQRRIADAADHVARLNVEEHEWAQLLSACAREGLPTLEIDACGPRLTDLFNDLLLASFGGRFTGQLVTQAIKAGGKVSKSGATHNEVIEFKIYDQQRGGAERDLHDLSGGQKVVVEEALRSAIALLVNARSTTPMRTCWRDETTGSLDPDSAIAYVSMLRRVQEIGGFYHLIFATHSPACWNLADSQLIVADGDITVALPPYAQEDPHELSIPPSRRHLGPINFGPALMHEAALRRGESL